MTKGEIRRQILAVRDGLLPEERRRMDRVIGEKVLSHPACREAQIILAYAGYRSEVDTMPLIRQAEGRRRRDGVLADFIRRGSA